jgi:hypothetical protein
MTFEVDNDALKLAMARHYEEKLAKELREMFVYSSNLDTARIWQLYLEEVQRKAEKENPTERVDTPRTLLIVISLGMMAYGIWQLFTHTPT